MKCSKLNKSQECQSQLTKKSNQSLFRSCTVEKLSAFMYKRNTKIVIDRSSEISLSSFAQSHFHLLIRSANDEAKEKELA
ncbi:CLUMA_CG018692, isoform A [Clunio marinus]|uniref:CLUMA_CG018692, isoform A n=1 Tax=Clunio marinus TaxID=568069 RepID=A0A1J1J002_9DIPT|nr:CLUMA_CG018692, isoform A [Clunio marinus]